MGIWRLIFNDDIADMKAYYEGDVTYFHLSKLVIGKRIYMYLTGPLF
jgi:hypothetical protein